MPRSTDQQIYKSVDEADALPVWAGPDRVDAKSTAAP